MSELPAIVTLMTDFGWGSYVAQMKGVLLSLAPTAQLIDIDHSIPPQDIMSGSMRLQEAATLFPRGTLHVAVVDPGVGTQRRMIYAEAGHWRFLLPDNGLLTYLLDDWPLHRAIELQATEFWRSPVSSTFHGRDILAPVAGHLLSGVDPTRLGPPAGGIIRLDPVIPTQSGDEIQGEVIAIDHFGNAITNISASHLQSLDRAKLSVHWESSPLAARWVRTYGDAARGDCVALLGSHDRLEIAIVEGHAANALGLRIGTKIWVSGKPQRPD